MRPAGVSTTKRAMIWLALPLSLMSARCPCVWRSVTSGWRNGYSVVLGQLRLQRRRMRQRGHAPARFVGAIAPAMRTIENVLAELDHRLHLSDPVRPHVGGVIV